MHEDLLGYLLGALEPHEMRRIAQLLDEDPELRAELAELERALEPLDEHLELMTDSPPSDLVARTLASLPDESMFGPFAAAEDPEVPDQRASAFRSETRPLNPWMGAREWGQRISWSWLDWIGGAAAAAIILGMLIPMLAEGRMAARKAACQDRLRQLGTALTQFVNRDAQGRLPAVAESGPEAFAGVYAVRLSDAGLLPDPSLRWCPSLPPPQRPKLSLVSLGRVESVADLHQAAPDLLREIQRFAGGHFAYTLGVVDRHRLRPPRFEGRASFAVMSDAPPAGFTSREDLRRFSGHGGRGINVLFEDGRVQFVTLPAVDAMPDHPLLNHRGEREAGVNIDDASLAPSWSAPFMDAVQR